MKMAVLKLFACSTMEAGLNENDGGCLAEGLNELENVTVPAKLLKLVTVTVEFVVWPFPRASSLLLLAVLNVGIGAKVYMAVCTVTEGGERLPLEKRTQ